MAAPQTIDDADIEEVGTDLELAPAAPVTLFRTDDPLAVVARATETARALSDVVKKQNLTVSIQGRDHVKVEGWTLLGTMLGVYPICTWTRQVMENGRAFGWEARVEARTLAGHLVGAAEAQCLRSEDQWSFEPKDRYGKTLKPRDDYALRSMAQTRATSKALRQPLGFVMNLAGFETTPAEEMPHPEERSQFAPPPSVQVPVDKPTQEQAKRLAELRAALDDKCPTPEGQPNWQLTIKKFAKDEFGKTAVATLSEAEMDKLLAVFQAHLDASSVPFGV